jgi:hypothetical protein
LTLETLTALRPNVVITSLEFQIAQANASAAEQKVTVLRMIAEKQLLAAQARLETLQRIESLGEKVLPGEVAAAKNRVRITQAEATVKILKMILEMN